MTVKYLDPYKDDLYGKLKGDKAETYFKVTFDEAKVYPTNDAYIIAAFVTSYSGIVRSFKASEVLVPGLCAIPIYGQEYEIREKDANGNWQGIKYQPSVFEKALYEYIKTNEAFFIPPSGGIKGELAFIPNGICASMDRASLEALVATNAKTEVIDLSGKLPQYTPPSNGGFKKNGGDSKGASIEEKLAFLKKQMTADIKDTSYTEEDSLATLTRRVHTENEDCEGFSDIYFEMLMAIIR